MRPLTIWTNFAPKILLAAKEEGRCGEHHILDSKSAGVGSSLSNADIAFGQPDPEQLIAAPSVKWCHLSSAGYTRYDRDDLRAAFKAKNAKLTNSSGVFSEPCAQHVLAMMLAQARRLPEALDDQRSGHTWPASLLRSRSRLLKGQTVLLVGFGAIGERVAELLAPFHLEVIAFRRRPRGDEQIPCVAMEQLEEWLPRADHVVNILPAATSTDNRFGAAQFKLMKPSAVFYNIGRGTTVDQQALGAALQAKRVAAAYLDVTTPEPLPPNDPLWTTPNCYITPHTAGGHMEEEKRVVEHFLGNLSQFALGAALQDVIF